MRADAPPFDIVQSGALAGVPHGFFGHSGGQFQFGYGGGGEPDVVARDRAAAANAIITGAPLVAPHQVHSADAIRAEHAWDDSVEGRPVADAVVTNRRGLVLGVVTADCAPVLFADTNAGVVGAAHAGWRGAHGGVLENTIAAMESLGASRANISAAIGPAIAQASYEVDDSFRVRFGQGNHGDPGDPGDPDEEGFFLVGRAGHWQFDLPAYVATRLRRAGIGGIDDLALDTYANPDRYYSFRRATHCGESAYGRQLGLIGLA